jgi:uncharacterized membrane protein YhaH (DUF805 family)
MDPGRLMNFPQAIASGFKNYVNFSGRAARSEFWYWMLFYVLGVIPVAILDDAILPGRLVFGDRGPILTVYDLIFWLPNLSMQVRRLHDVDRSGWWLLISVTVVGLVYPLLFWLCKKGTEGSNRFGDDFLDSDRIVAQFE